MSVQTNLGIMRMIEAGDIVMAPYRKEQINNGSVDVSLGRYVCRISRHYQGHGPATVKLNQTKAGDFFYLDDLQASANGGVLRLGKHERVLAHTHEFIGSRRNCLPEMRAKSTMARWGLTVCACAGWGDVGYFNRWAMEIYNMNPGPVEIELGTLVAQIVFHECQQPSEGTLYNQPGAGSYQQGEDLDELIAKWSPESLLPKPMKSIPLEPMNERDRQAPLWPPRF